MKHTKNKNVLNQVRIIEIHLKPSYFKSISSMESNIGSVISGISMPRVPGVKAYSSESVKNEIISTWMKVDLNSQIILMDL